MAKPTKKALTVPQGCKGCRPCRSHGIFPCNCRFCKDCLEQMKCSHGVPHGAFFARETGKDKAWRRACYDSGERSYKGALYSEHHVNMNLKHDAAEKLRLENKAARKAVREARQERASKRAALQAASDATAGGTSSSSGQ